MIRYITLVLLFTNFLLPAAHAQQATGIITGFVTDKNTLEKLPGVVIVIENTSNGTSTNIDGYYHLENVPVGSYNLKATFLGYKPMIKFNVNVTSGNIQVINFDIEPESKTLNEVNIVFDRGRTASPVDMVTPLSVQSLTTEEIRSNPGGNFDISKVVQVLPGVAGGTSASFRNDIVIRGGAPNENVFYLDGIEIPVLNHFQTQGSSGGPAGILNVSFIEDVKLSTSAFDARYDNALASVFQFRQRNGNKERFSGNIRTSSTEVAATLEGPIGKNTTYIVSARRSYLQALFALIDLPIRPNYWDFQYKLTTQLSEKTSISFIGIGAIDEFSFAAPRESTPDKVYILNSIPSIDQWTYTTGVSLKHRINNGFLNVALSRNVFNNRLDRFENKEIGNESKRILKLRSEEAENKLRVDVNKFTNGWKWSYGLSAQQSEFTNSIFNRLRNEIRNSSGTVIQPALIINSADAIDFFRYGLFAQAAKYFYDERLLLSGGIRSDVNSFTDQGMDPLQTLSPRFSVSYKLFPKISLNASAGRYFKLPPYTILGHRENGVLVNSDAKYIRSDHYVAGMEYLPKEDLRFTVEGFVKNYGNYPVSVRDGISLANQGSDFGFIGNESVNSSGRGRAFGIEVYGQQKLINDYFAVVSYTFVRSKFSGDDGRLIASAWDYRHLLSMLIGKKFKRGWEAGIKYRYFGGAPFTPFDEQASRLNFLSSGTGVLDFSQLNTRRLRPFSQLDIRIDKKINFKKATLDVFLDLVNALAYRSPEYPRYSFKRTEDNNAFVTTDGQAIAADGSNGIPVLLQDEAAIITPSLGIILEF